MPFSIKLSRPVVPGRIPSFDTCMQSARQIMADTANWTEGKTFNDGSCRTYIKKIPSGPPWHMRVTRHGPQDGTFTDFWNALGSNHAENELQYIPELSKATMMQAIEPGVMEVWSLHYALSSPFSPRTFTVLMVTHLEAVSPRQGWVISIPFDPKGDEGLMSLEERGVRGRYAAVERLRELEDGTVEWRVATTTTVGGFVPDWVTTRAVPKAIAEDVLQFLAWMRQKRGQGAGSANNVVATSSKTA
ncbi:hypothetical protein M407DRAFT_149287 [Tulasnella calospora MUT 4182]|uniref:DUF3074 domain-containing protein n=1 Tax=Tulasnella calospora MUT 4182 TaxID=1051891 RepID=A0A0C3QGB6_9AGAM|nr:hypothetical protein M407DRAFT_149287 [Tulasnella calospora MUT 4182]